MYEEKTYEYILDRMLDRVDDSFDKREGSVIYDALAPAASELAMMYMELDIILSLTFADSATGEYLDRRCAERGVIRESATNAVMKGIFTPSTVEIPLNARFTCDGIGYYVSKKIADGAYQLTCEETGAARNASLETLIPADYIDGLETAELTELLIPGEDTESDESLRSRYFDTFASKAYGGNETDYKEKTNSINGVGAVKVTPVWDGGGTVKLTILDSDYNKASDTLIDTVQNTIDPTKDGCGVGIAPIGHVVTVDTVYELSIKISTSMTFDVGYSFDSLKTTIENTIKTYLLDLRKYWANGTNTIVRTSQIESKLMAIDGIIDIANTKLNGSTGNITCDEYQVPVFGGVTNG
jgi:uncharacterized phage protein gp47/JayE